MLHIVWLVTTAGLGFSGLVQAQACPCPAGNRLNHTQIVNALGDKTVCATLGSGASAERWQEFHTGNTTAGGSLVDYKRGPGHPIDPQKTVGSWSVVDTGANARIRYNYGAGTTYDYVVCSQGGNLHFCGARNVTNATVLSTQGSCGF